MGDPPPKAIIISGSYALSSSIPFMISSSVGSGFTSEYILASIPLDFRMFVILSATFNFTIFSSVTKNTFSISKVLNISKELGPK